MAEFDVQAGGLKAQANLDIKPKWDKFLTWAEKRDIEIADDATKLYKQYETPLNILGGGIASLLGHNVDIPPLERGPHSAGIRDINLKDLIDLEPRGELFYRYDEEPFDIEATIGGSPEEQRAMIEGTINFAEGGISQTPWNPDEHMVRDAAWIEGRDWYRGPSGEQIPIYRGPRPGPPPKQLMHPEKIKYLERINDREYAPQMPGFVPLPRPDMMPKDGGALIGFGPGDSISRGPWEVLPGGSEFDERGNGIGIDDNLIPPRNTGIRANTGSPALARTPQQPLRRGPTSSNPRNPYVSSVANHPSINPPTIPTMGGGLDSLDRVGWGTF